MAGWLLYTFYSLIALTMALESRNFRILIDQLELKPVAPKSDGIIKELSSELMQIEKRSYISIRMVLLQNVERVNVRAYLDFWKNKSSNKIRVYDLNMDACRFLSTVHRNRLYTMFTKSFEQQLNAKFKCPFKANFNYTLKNWFLDEKDFPSYVPICEYEGTIELIMENQTLTRAKYHGKILPNKK